MVLDLKCGFPLQSSIEAATRHALEGTYRWKLIDREHKKAFLSSIAKGACVAVFCYATLEITARLTQMPDPIMVSSIKQTIGEEENGLTRYFSTEAPVYGWGHASNVEVRPHSDGTVDTKPNTCRALVETSAGAIQSSRIPNPTVEI